MNDKQTPIMTLGTLRAIIKLYNYHNGVLGIIRDQWNEIRHARVSTAFRLDHLLSNAVEHSESPDDGDNPKLDMEQIFNLLQILAHDANQKRYGAGHITLCQLSESYFQSSYEHQHSPEQLKKL